MSACEKCRHPERQHNPLGCSHEIHTEICVEEPDAVTIHTDLRLCGCEYFRGRTGKR